MQRFFSKFLGVVALATVSLAAFAGNITVTSPAAGSAGSPTLVGATTQVKFNTLSTQPGATRVTVTLTVRKLSDNTVITTSDTTVDPDNDGKGSGQIALSFTRGVNEEVPYKIEVRAKELGRPAEVYNSNQNLFVLPDLTKPKILQYNPGQVTFVKGVVPITVQISEANLKDWRIQVNSQDIPGNTGTTVDSNGVFTVNWNTTGILSDGPQTINIRVRDQADNETTQNIDVTVDRIPPTVTVLTPRSGSTLSPGTTINIQVDVTDASQNSVDVTGLDVVARKLDGTYLARAARVSFNSAGGTTRRWTGRIRWRQGLLPAQFKIVVSAIDRAGNVASPQSVTVRIGP